MIKQTKSLAFLLSGIAVVDPEIDTEIYGLSMDSRQVKPGDLFIAYPGEKVDGRDFIQQAIQLGAVAILVEDCTMDDICLKQFSSPKRIFMAKNVQQKVSQIAARFYDHPSRKIHITGITGTNGKTSIAYLLSWAFDVLNSSISHKNTSVYFGTLGIGFPDALQESTHTTLDPIHLQQYLTKFVKKQVTHATLEVSSHALDQGRVTQIEFETAVFTNLTRDHLDYHKTMEAYGEAKAKLFKQFGLKSAVINWDDPFGFNLYESLVDSIFKIGYSLNNSKADIYADNIIYSFQGIEANIKTPWGDGVLRTPLIGRFNLYNILAVIGVLGLSYPLKKILSCIETLPHVPGRMECIISANNEKNIKLKPLMIIDYAHTPDALQNVLITARDLTRETEGKLWCVFGCGGDRDNGKRSEMGKIAQKYSDYCVITNDNPRSEDPKKIAEDILSGITNVSVQAEDRLIIILDRKKAITYAFEQAKPNDIILVAGKGHESYQIIGSQKFDFSDKRISLELLEKK